MLFISCLLAVAGCGHFPTPVISIKPSAAEMELKQALQERDAKVAELEKKITDLDKLFKDKFDANISLGAASVWSVYDTMLADPDKDKYDNAEIAGIEVAIKALPQPTLSDYKKTSETQRKLLSEQAEEIARGKAEIEAQKKLTEESKKEQEKILAEKARIEEQKIAAAKDFENKKRELDNKILLEQKEKTAEAQERLRQEQENKDLKALIVKILMVVGVIAGILAAVTKTVTPAICSAAAIGLAIAVSFLPLYMIVIGLVVIFSLIAFSIFLKFKESHQALKNVVGATQEFKNENKELFKNGLAKNLDEWNSSNPKTVKVIDNTLKELNLK